MEGVQERGTKRSCGEALLPQRAASGQKNPGALLVDASGAPAASMPEGGIDGERPSEGVPTAEGDGADCLLPEQPAAVQLLAKPMEVEPNRENAGAEKQAPPADEGPLAKGEKNIDDDEKEESRKSFSALVNATCSHRAYPY